MKGIEKHIDSLGRIVLPMKYRNKLGMKNKSKVSLSLEGNSIIITPITKRCALCGSYKNINEELNLCNACIIKINAHTEKGLNNTD